MNINKDSTRFSLKTAYMHNEHEKNIAPIRDDDDDLEMQDVSIDKEHYVAETFTPTKRAVASTKTTKRLVTPKPSYGRKVLELVLALAAIAAVIAGLTIALTNKDNGGNDNQAAAVSNSALNNPTNDDNNDVAALPELPCPFESELDVRNDGSLLLRQFVNAQAQTVTIQLEYNDIAWLGFAFSEQPLMVPNTAMIGLPDEDSVLKYNLGGKSVSAVIPLEEDRQTLTDQSIIQQNGKTILTFTKALVEEGELAVSGTAASTRFLWAIGADNDLGRHRFRGSSTVELASCLKNDNQGELEEKETPVSLPSPVSNAPTNSPTVRLTAAPTKSPTTVPTTSPTVLSVITIAPTNSPTARLTSAPTETPTIVTTMAPTIFPTSALTQNPTVVVTSPPTMAPTGAKPSGTWSKMGNRRSCAIDHCPSDYWWGSNQLANGCTCQDGLDVCYWDGAPTTVEYFTHLNWRPTNLANIWKVEGTGQTLNVGEGGDYASGSDCFDDPLRGGFRVDLTGTGFEFVGAHSTVTVSGWSPVMRLIVDGYNAGEAREWASNADLSLAIPDGSTTVEVSCGGWPASCSSELYIRPVSTGGY